MCRHDSPLGVDALASCAACQAYKLAALAARVEPPRHLPGVLHCGHRMENMDLCCPVCAEHVVSIEKAMGGSGPALEIVGGIGGPLRPDPATFLRVDPGGYLRIATDDLAGSPGKANLPFRCRKPSKQPKCLICSSRVTGSWDSPMATSPGSGVLGRIITRAIWTTRTLAGAIHR